MKATTTWAFRREHLPTYGERDFDTTWDYFIYLHLNRHVQVLHAFPTLVALCYFPHAITAFFTRLEILPMALFTFVYYGIGFISHFTGDGQVSQTWRQILLTYAHALRLNLLFFTARFGREEERFRKRYPHVLWVYLADQPQPAGVAERASAKQALEPGRVLAAQDR